MRIVHVDTGPRMRGGQWQALFLHQGLVEAGWDSVLLARPGSPLLREARARDLPAECLRLPTLLRLARGADLIHAHDARAHTLAALTGHPRLIVSRRVGFAPRASVWFRWKLRKAKRYLAVSQYVRGVLLAAGVEASRVSVVYDGVPLLPPSSRAGPAIAPAEDDPMKGESLLQEAEAAGGFRVLRSHDLVADLGVASLMVYLSRMEGLGSGVLLAMSAAVPVVASKVGGLTEAVVDGQTGLLVENAAGAIADAVNRLTGDRELAARMGEAGRQRILEQFTIEHMVQRTLQNYEEVLSCRT